LSSPEVNASRAARESGKRVLVGALTSETTEVWALPEGGLPPGDHGPGWASSARRRVPRSRLGRLCRIYLILGIRRSGMPNDLWRCWTQSTHQAVGAPPADSADPWHTRLDLLDAVGW